MKTLETASKTSCFIGSCFVNKVQGVHNKNRPTPVSLSGGNAELTIVLNNIMPSCDNTATLAHGSDMREKLQRGN
jgi:hypothetical protein